MSQKGYFTFSFPLIIFSQSTNLQPINKVDRLAVSLQVYRKVDHYSEQLISYQLSTKRSGFVSDQCDFEVSAHVGSGEDTFFDAWRRRRKKWTPARGDTGDLIGLSFQVLCSFRVVVLSSRPVVPNLFDLATRLVRSHYMK